MATLEIPELELQAQARRRGHQERAGADHARQDELNRVEAQHKVLQLQYDRLNGVAKSKPGLVAQQEVDDAQGRALAAEAQVEAAEVESAIGAKPTGRGAGQAGARPGAVRLFENHRAVRRRGDAALRQPGHIDAGGHQLQHASLPLVRLSEDDLFRLVIPGAGILCAVHSHRRSGQRECSVAGPQLPGEGGPVLRGCQGRHAHHAHRSGCSEPATGAAARACTRTRRSRWSRRTTRWRCRCRRWTTTADRTTVDVVNASDKIESQAHCVSASRPPRCLEVVSGLQEGDWWW